MPEKTILEWNDSLSVGLPEIDRQHKRLLELMRKVEKAADLGQKDALLKAVEELAIYTKSHFEAEETLMSKVNYPAIRAHSKTHENLLGEVSAMAGKLKDGSIKTDDLLAFLMKWLVEHINGSDKAYANTVLKSGLSLEKLGMALSEDLARNKEKNEKKGFFSFFGSFFRK